MLAKPESSKFELQETSQGSDLLSKCTSFSLVKELYINLFAELQRNAYYDASEYQCYQGLGNIRCVQCHMMLKEL